MTKKIYLETLKKCPGSLHLPLLPNTREVCKRALPSYFFIIITSVHLKNVPLSQM